MRNLCIYYYYYYYLKLLLYLKIWPTFYVIVLFILKLYTVCILKCVNRVFNIMNYGTPTNLHFVISGLFFFAFLDRIVRNLLYTLYNEFQKKLNFSCYFAPAANNCCKFHAQGVFSIIKLSFILLLELAFSPLS